MSQARGQAIARRIIKKLASLGFYGINADGQEVPLPVKKVHYNRSLDAYEVRLNFAKIKYLRGSRRTITAEALTSEAVLHDLSTELRGKRVTVFNTKGLAYRVWMSDPPDFPKQILLSLPEIPNNILYPIPLGADRESKLHWTSLDTCGGVLIGGSTRMGKSNLIQSWIISLTERHPPRDIQFYILDLKAVEMAGWNGLPHLAARVATTPAEATTALDDLTTEIERRKELFLACGATNFRQYNAYNKKEPLPLIVLIFEELATLRDDLDKITGQIITITSVGVGLGIIPILSAQNPKFKVIDTAARENLLLRIAFRCGASNQSQVIIGQSGAEKLPVPGRALVLKDGVLAERQMLLVSGPMLKVKQPQQVLSLPKHRMLTAEEQTWMNWAVTENSGQFPIQAVAKQFGVTEHKVRKFAKEAETRQWLSPGHGRKPRTVIQNTF